MKSMIIVQSHHHHNTEKVARALAEVLQAPVKTPGEITAEPFAGCDLVGLGSGIYNDQLHPVLLSVADKLPPGKKLKVFTFSTCGAFTDLEAYAARCHAALKDKLAARGYEYLGLFNCKGWDTNKFLKFFGGINRGHPDAQDLRNAAAFAGKLR